MVDTKTRLSNDEWTAFAIYLALASIVFSLGRTAAAAIAHARYLDRPLSLGAAYRLAVQRMGAQIVAQLFAGVFLLKLVFVLVIPVVVTAGIATSGGTPGTVPIIVSMVVAGTVGLVAGAWLFLALELATVQIATGAKGSYTALFAALGATVFRRPWQSLLTALALMFVVFGASLVISGLTSLMSSSALRAFMTFGVGSVVIIVTEAISVAFLVAYDVDLGVRHKGLDFEAALDG